MPASSLAPENTFKAENYMDWENMKVKRKEFSSDEIFSLDATKEVEAKCI